MREATKIVRSTLSEVAAGQPMHAGPMFAAPFHTPGDPAGVPYTYARSHNPTWTALERAIAGMESGDGYEAKALVFASGMAAVAAVFGAVLRPGDTVVMPSNAYFAARVLVEEYFVAMGIQMRVAPTAGDAQRGELEGAKLLWLETPSNPTMEICDIRELSAVARAAGVLVAVDNSTATPLGQRVLELGADFSVVSDTKAMSGHSDILLGHVAVRDAALYERLEQWRTLTGGVPGPMEAWLALRSLPTLPLRLERSSESAMRVATFLEGRAEVVAVMYPGLPTHPGHAVAAGQMRHFGPVLSFVLRDRRAAERFLGAAQLVTEATSFGGVTTTAERRARWRHDDVEEGFIRMSVGCEDADDLIEDMGRALEATV
jgi:cystathionine gamma-lyase